VLYLVRPQLGLDLLRIMASEEYRAHFTTARPPPPAP
jgi:hypothetical protein